MTDKEIIINGIDVSECAYLKPLDNGVYECITGTQQCLKYRVCECNHNCYFKQLKRKEQECEELKTMVAEAEEASICFHCSEEPCIRQQRDKYKKLSVVFKDVNKQLGYKYITLKQALEEIENYVQDNSDFDKSDKLTSNTGAYDILEIINKVKK